MYEMLIELERLEAIADDMDLLPPSQHIAYEHLKKWKHQNSNWESIKFNPEYHPDPWYGGVKGEHDYRGH